MRAMTNAWPDAVVNIYPQWEAAARHATPTTMAAAGLYALAGLALCARGLATRRDDPARGWWFEVAGVLGLLGANVALRPDLLTLAVLRHLARIDGWYVDRRGWQLVALGLLGIAGAAALRRWRTPLATAWQRAPSIVLGVGLLGVIALLRAVSHHATDLVFDARVSGVTVGRLLELCSLALAAGGAVCGPRPA